MRIIKIASAANIKLSNTDQYGEEMPVDANGKSEADEIDGGAVGDGIESQKGNVENENDPIKTFISQLSEKIGKTITLINKPLTYYSKDFDIYSFESGTLLSNDELSFMSSFGLSVYLTTHATNGGLILYIFKKK